MIEGDPRENVRLAQELMAVLRDRVDAKRAAQIMMFAAVLVIRSNHILASPEGLARLADRYLEDIRDDLQRPLSATPIDG